MPVKASDVISIPEESRWILTPVVWRQKLKEYNKNYMCIEFTNTRVDEPEKTNFLFVSEEILDHFKLSKIEKTDTGYKLTVDEEYLFGQQKGGKNRFLVYYDKERAILQHRFVQGTLEVISRQATEISMKFGYGEVKMMSASMTGTIGEPLHPMSDASK
ncbi:hypothetical protein FBEOM_11499 [Fusarium beomiforme]|uniref:Uncharacterized protein n=1 Tax=Fusarium beomiforme TaxID=44412 RepID=A0A9P5A9Y0_9HYPO|nr:hypothetical protein FBEOM_11499 [Fusarium beomiforme]